MIPSYLGAGRRGTAAAVKSQSSTCHEVLLNLLVHAVESSLPIGRDQLSLSVFPGPGFKLAGADVFVTQAQRPQGGAGKLLEQTTDTRPSQLGARQNQTGSTDEKTAGRGNSRPEPSGWRPCTWSWETVAHR